MSDQDNSLRDSLPPGPRRELYDQWSAAMKAAPRFVRDPIEAVESIANDPTATWAERVLAKIKLKAWGNYSPYAIHDDGRPMTQEDIADALGTDKQRVSDGVLYQVARGRMRPKSEIGKLLWPAIAPKAAPKPDEYKEKSGRYRTFLEVWRLANSSEYAEFEAAEITVKRIKTKILSEFRAAKRKSGRSGLQAEKSGDDINSGPDSADKKSTASRTASLLKIPSDTEDSQDAGGRASSIRESAIATAPLTARPPADSPIVEALRAFLVKRFGRVVGTAPDPMILAQIAAYIPDAAALEQFKTAAEKTKPKKWALFVSVAAQCAEERKAQSELAETRPKPQSAEERAAEELATYLMDLDNPDLSEAEHETARRKITEATAAIAAEARRLYEAMKPRVAAAAE